MARGKRLAALNEDILRSLPKQKAERLRGLQENFFRNWKMLGPWDSGGATASRILYSAFYRGAAADTETFRSPPTEGSMSASLDGEADETFASWFAALRSAEKGELWHLKGQILEVSENAEALCRFVEGTAETSERAKLLDHILGLYSSAVRLGELTGRNAFAERKKAAKARSGVTSRIEERRIELSAAVRREVQKSPKATDKQIAKALKRSGVKITTTDATLAKDIESIRADARQSKPQSPENDLAIGKNTG